MKAPICFSTWPTGHSTGPSDFPRSSILQSQGKGVGQDATSPTKAPNTAVTPVKYRSQAAVVVSCRVITTEDLASALANAAGRDRSSLVDGCSLQGLCQAEQEEFSASEQCSDTTSETSSGSLAVSVNPMYSSAPEDEGVESVISSGENGRRYFSDETARSSVVTGAQDQEDYEYSRSKCPPADVGADQRKNNGRSGEAIDNGDHGGCDQAGSSKCLSNVRGASLASKCFEELEVSWRENRGCEDANKHHWRDRSASNPRTPGAYVAREGCTCSQSILKNNRLTQVFHAGQRVNQPVFVFVCVPLSADWASTRYDCQFLSPSSCLRVGSRELGSSVPSRVSPRFLHSQGESGA